MGTNKTNKRSIKTTLLAITMGPAIVIAFLLTTVSANILTSKLNDQTFEGLRVTASSVRAAIDQMSEDDFRINNSGHLVKGDWDFTEQGDFLDPYVEGTDTELTFFWGNRRYVTTFFDNDGNRMIDTSCDMDLYRKVMEGTDVRLEDMNMEGVKYFGYYVPVYNNSGTVTGMVFAGVPQESANRALKQSIFILSTISTICIIICVILGIFISRIVSNFITSSAKYLDIIAGGDLSFEVDKKLTKRTDEFGNMGRSFEFLRDKLIEIMGEIQKSANVVLSSGDSLETMAHETSSNADEISHAVDDIAKGAINQSEEVQQATERVNEMGRTIEQIVNQIGVLEETSRVMIAAGNESAAIMESLSESNDQTVSAIMRVSENVAATDECVQRIAEAVGLISSIADQTNLLSLNASIEAARAGEAGKGFAVVATEIQKLSQESNESTQRIADAISELSKASQSSMEVMEEVKTKLAETEARLGETKTKFTSVTDGINTSRQGTNEINAQAQNCDSARVSVIDIVSSLSAISEENAASSQQTTASMQELNATINLVAQSSKDLKDLAASLDNATRYFRIDE